MLNGILSRIAISILLLFPITLKAQYSYRIEVKYESGTCNLSDKNYINDWINYPYERKGNSNAISITYNLKESPLSIELSSDITSVDYMNEKGYLKINDYKLKMRYVFFRKSSFKPFLGLGLVYGRFSYNGTSINFNYLENSNDEYIQVDNITWLNNNTDSNFNTIGITSSVGVQFRITDKIGLVSTANLDFLYQNQKNWIGKNIYIQSYKVGLYYRFSQRKNILI